MKMKRMTFSKFVSYVLDERIKTRRPDPQLEKLEIFYHNPVDVRGKPSSFVLVVLLGTKKDEIYCAATKLNPVDDKFSLEEGLKQACNRVWREYHGGKSLYGKGHGKNRTPGARLEKLRARIASSLGLMGNRPIPYNFPAMPKYLMEARRKLIAAISEERNATKKS